MELTLLSDDENIVRIQIAGRITTNEMSNHTEPIVDLVGSEVYKRKVLVDLETVSFIDSTGIGWLLRCHKRFTDAGGRMVLHSIPPLVDNVLKVLKLELVLQLAADDRAATAMVGGEST